MSGVAARQRTFTKAPEPAPVVSVRPMSQAVQRSALRVSQRSDPAEKEAESTARKIMRMEATPSIARFAESARLIARAGSGPPPPNSAPAGIGAEIAQARGGGAPLAMPLRNVMESRFRADFSRVRVHTGDTAARLARAVNAHAFTIGNDIFFGKDKFRPDSSEGRELLAHELTHTIQQGGATQERVQRSEDTSVGERSTPHVARLGISDALDFFARQANNIPGFRMFTIVLGVNPINMSRVERSAANILRAVVEFIPGGGLIVQALDAYGVFERAGSWIEQQLRALGITGQSIRDAIDRFLDSLGWSDIFDLGGVWDRAVRIFRTPIDRILTLLRSVGGEILRLIKDAILMPLARLASRTRGWDLLCAVLGRNPITGEPVPRNAETLIGGFMRLIGQEEIWQNIQRSGAVARAWAWFQGALSGLIGFVSRIPELFMQAVRELEIADIVVLPRAFLRVGRVFASFAVEFFSWAGGTIWSLLEIIFSVVAPGAMSYLQRARQAFRNILRNPIGFVGNLVRAGIQGMRQFGRNFLTHLRTALVGWLTGALSGANIYIPQAFTLGEIVKFVLSVLGLTWQNIRQKLVRAIGEPAVVVLERAFEIVQTLVTQGPAAAWEKIAESLTNLRDLVIEQVMTFVRDRIITAAITRLVSMLNPAGAFIQAIIAIYNTIMFFVERMRQLIEFVRNAIDAIHPISIGNVTAAANAMERGLVTGLTLVISFLARLVGLGRVSDAVTNVINRVRQPIDRALDRVVAWIVEQARRLGRLALQAGVPQDPVERVRRAGRDAVAIARRLRGRVSRSLLEPALSVLRTRYGLSRIEAREQNGQWWVFTKVNAEQNTPTGISTDPNAAAPGAAAPDLLGPPVTFASAQGSKTLRVRVVNRRPSVTINPPEVPLQQRMDEWRRHFDGWRDASGKEEASRLLGLLQGRLRELNEDASRLMTVMTSATDPRGSHIAQLRDKEDAVINGCLVQIYELLPDAAGSRVRFDRAWTVPALQRVFTQAVWQSALSCSNTTAWKDLNWGESVGRLEIVGRDQYRLRQMDSAELERNMVRILLARGRDPAREIGDAHGIGVRGQAFTVANLQRFFQHPQLPGIPRTPALFTPEVVGRIAESLVGQMLERAGSGSYRWSFRLHDERTLPDGWRADETRYKFYIRSSGYGAAAASVRRTTMPNVIAAVEACHANQPNGPALWAALWNDRVVPDQRYDDARYAAYKNPENYQVDHVTPLAWHWMHANGWNCSDQDRKDVAGGRGEYRLRLMWGDANRERGATPEGGERGSYARRTVGPRFTSAWAPSDTNFIWADEARAFREYAGIARR